MQPVAAQPKMKNKNKYETEMGGKKRKIKRNPKRNPQNKTANDNPDDDFPFSNVFGSVCLYFAGSAAFGGQKIRRQLTTAAATPTAATPTAATATLATATSQHRHRHNSNNFSFRFSRGACQKKRSNQTAKDYG